MGQPMHGFPEKLQSIVLKGEQPITGRPGELLPPEDFDKIAKLLEEKYGIVSDNKAVLSYALYPDVYEGYLKYISEFGDLGRMGSDIFFHGLAEGETSEISVASGKTFMMKLLEIGKLDIEGNRTVVFEVDGNRREIKIKDKNNKTAPQALAKTMADPEDKAQIGAPIPGNVLAIIVSEGEEVKENQPVMIIEAMKMETRVTSSQAGIVGIINVKEGQQVSAGELLLTLK